MGYATFSTLLAQLDLSESNPDDADDITLLHECDDAVSIQFEQKAGFDVTQSPIWGDDADATATTRTCDGEGSQFYSRFLPIPALSVSDLLFLPIPARSITDVQVVGVFAETLTSAQWIPWFVDNLGIAMGIKRIDYRGWPIRDGRTRVEVTAVWANGPIGGDPPAIVAAACTFIAADEFRMRKTSPSGQIGPDLLTIRPRNPWGFDVVKTAIAAVNVPRYTRLL